MSALAPAAIVPVLTRKRLIRVALLAWFAIMSLDFFLNAGVLAPFYNWELPGLLPPIMMFKLIPLGYAAFLLWSIVLVWLVVRTQSFGFRAGAVFGAKLGALLGAAAFLGWLSLSHV
jgi:hypothetical protein